MRTSAPHFVATARSPIAPGSRQIRWLRDPDSAAGDRPSRRPTALVSRAASSSEHANGRLGAVEPADPRMAADQRRDLGGDRGPADAAREPRHDDDAHRREDMRDRDRAVLLTRRPDRRPPAPLRDRLQGRRSGVGRSDPPSLAAPGNVEQAGADRSPGPAIRQVGRSPYPLVRPHQPWRRGSCTAPLISDLRATSLRTHVPGPRTPDDSGSSG